MRTTQCNISSIRRRYISCLTVSILLLVSQVTHSLTPLSRPSLSRLTTRQSTLLYTKNKDSQQDEVVETLSQSQLDRRNLVINTLAGGLIVASGVASAYLFQQTLYTPPGFTRLPSTQFIAAIDSPTASQGVSAKDWGLWKLDPGPRGVHLRDYERLIASQDNAAPLGWKFNPQDWWVEEHGE
jgi:hypothetical protein